MTETILVVNAGSSSIKFQLFAVGIADQLERRLKGQIEGVGIKPATCLPRTRREKSLSMRHGPRRKLPPYRRRSTSSSRFLRKEIGEAGRWRLGTVLCMVGRDIASRWPLLPSCSNELERFSPLAPLHQPNNIAPIRAILERQPHVLQVACFDTAFHRNHPDVADRFAIPEAALR